MRTLLRTAVLAAACAASLSACGNHSMPTPVSPSSPRAQAFLDTLEQRTFAFFWERTDPATGLTPDRWPTQSFSSVAAIGFALTAYPIGVERGYVSRAQARDRVLTTLRSLWTAPQGPAASGVTGYHGFFYHFLDMSTGHRFQTVELSSIDTALLLGGVLFCQGYFDGTDADEAAIRAYADSLYRRVEWTWMQPRGPLVAMGWTPEQGFHTLDWTGYNEAMLLYVLALGSPTFPIDSTAWAAWTSTYRWETFHGQAHVGFGPLFGHQYSHVWVDFRGIRDAYMTSRGLDYFENSRRATLAQRAHAIANPAGWRDYGADLWGVTASDGPVDATLTIDGRQRRFYTYAGRGVSASWSLDDGTIAPTGAGGSVPFAPEFAIPTLIAMRERYGVPLFGSYGFLDALNPTYRTTQPPQQGQVVGGLGWFDTDYLGIDQGPILAMVENYRSDLVWRVMRGHPAVIRGLRRAGFSGGWLATAPSPGPR
jgi:hypothetical protein